MNAVIKVGGKQYYVTEGAEIYVEKLNCKAKKIKVFKYKSKDRSNRVKQGHRQPYTKIKITKIG